MKINPYIIMHFYLLKVYLFQNLKKKHTYIYVFNHNYKSHTTI